MSKIKVDIDELISRLQEIKQEDFVVVELEIDDTAYEPELCLTAIGLDDTETTDYGRIYEVDEELMWNQIIKNIMWYNKI